jgi:hypothetical protein
MPAIKLQEVKEPLKDCNLQPYILSDKTMKERLQKTLLKMKAELLDCLVIYADIEHSGNFEYLSGFIPRFEEALLVLQADGCAYALLGNENLNKAQHFRLAVEAIHVPHFSLPNQPMLTKESIVELLAKADIRKGYKVGIVGWKLFTSNCEDNTTIFEIPSYLVKAIKELVQTETVVNATNLFIGDEGLRRVCNSEELRFYEFGAALASDCMLEALNSLRVGIKEMEVADILNAYGQRNSVVTVAAFGLRFEKANVFPTAKQAKLGDAVSLTVAYKGGLSCRTGYLVKQTSELPLACQDYLEVLVKPYYQAVVCWLESLKCNIPGNKIYQLIEAVLPKAKYNWQLCPGHLGADEEWLCSPIYENSTELLRSGMIFQVDILPSLVGYNGASAESTICLADQDLQAKLAKEQPDLWARIQKRRAYIINELNIKLAPEVLPLCSTVAYLRPYLLAPTLALKVKD